MTTPRVGRFGVPLLIVALFVIAILLPFYSQSFTVIRLTQAVAFAVSLIGLNLATGHCGIVSLGQNAFFAVGAYTVGYFGGKHGWSPPLVVLAVIVVSLVIGVVVSTPLVRLSGINLALATLAIGFVTPALILRLAPITGGANGQAIPPLHAPAVLNMSDIAFLYYVGLVVLAVGMVLYFGIVRSQAGRALKAVRDRPVPAEALGVNLIRVRRGILTANWVFAGLGGWIYALSAQFAGAETFSLDLGINFLAGIVIGGLGYAAAPVIGALFMEYVPTFSSGINTALGSMIQGVLIVLVMLVARQGASGLILDLWRFGVRTVRRSGGSRPPAPEQLGPCADDPPDKPAGDRIDGAETTRVTR